MERKTDVHGSVQKLVNIVVERQAVFLLKVEKDI